MLKYDAYLVINPITVNKCPLNCTPVDRVSDRLKHKAIHFSWLKPELFRQLLGPLEAGTLLMIFSLQSINGVV